MTDGSVLSRRRARAMLNAQPVDEDRGYGYGIYRVRLPSTAAVYGHRGGTPGFSCLGLTTDTGRTIVLYQNSLDTALTLDWNNPFTTATLP